MCHISYIMFAYFILSKIPKKQPLVGILHAHRPVGLTPDRSVLVLPTQGELCFISDQSVRPVELPSELHWSRPTGRPDQSDCLCVLPKISSVLSVFLEPVEPTGPYVFRILPTCRTDRSDILLLLLLILYFVSGPQGTGRTDRSSH